MNNKEVKTMSIGLVGRKCGMTRIFDDQKAVPVTVVRVESNKVTQIKTAEVDGYTAIQITAGLAKRSRVSKPLSQHYAKAGVEPGVGLWEFRVDADQVANFQAGAELSVDRFEVGQKIDVTGTSKGKGFAGGVKRHNFSMQDATHGNSLSHRAIGSTGQNQTPGRVFKGKKMPGQMGNVRTTVQGSEVIAVDVNRGLIMVKGGVPGAPGGYVIIRPTTKGGKS